MKKLSFDCKLWPSLIDSLSFFECFLQSSLAFAHCLPVFSVFRFLSQVFPSHFAGLAKALNVGGISELSFMTQVG